MHSSPFSSTFGHLPQRVPLPDDASVEAKIGLLKTELRFYWQLVIWLTFISHDDCMPVLEGYRDELRVFRMVHLPALQRRVQRLQERGAADQRAAAAQLQRHYHRTEQAFATLKYNLQRQFLDFIHVSIW